MCEIGAGNTKGTKNLTQAQQENSNFFPSNRDNASYYPTNNYGPHSYSSSFSMPVPMGCGHMHPMQPLSMNQMNQGGCFYPMENPPNYFGQVKWNYNPNLSYGEELFLANGPSSYYKDMDNVEPVTPHFGAEEVSVELDQ